MKSLYRLPLFFAMFLPLAAAGQKSWTLQECIRYAWENNIQLKQQEIASEQNKNNVLEAKMEFLPTVNSSVSHSMNWGRSVNMNDLQIIRNQLSQSTSVSLSASLTLFNGFAKQNNVASKKLLYEISELDAEKIKNNISLQISKAYLQILLSKEILRVSEENYKSIFEQVERTRKLVSAGNMAMGSQLEMEAQLASGRVQVVDAQSQLKTNLLTLRQLLTLPENEVFEIATPDIEGKIKSYMGENVNDLYNRSLNLPQIKSAKIAEENYALQLKIAKAQMIPSVRMSASYGSYFADSRSESFFNQIKDNRNPSLGFSLSIPIFNALNAKTSVKNSRLALKSASLNVIDWQQQIYKEVEQANNDALSYFEKLLASEQNVKSMEESFRYVKEKFNIGALNATDYTVSSTNLLKAKSEYLQAKYQFVFQLKVLDFYKGIEIVL